MFEITEKVKLPKEVINSMDELKKSLERYRSATPYIIVQNGLKIDAIDKWIREDISTNQLALILAVMYGYEEV